MTSSPPRISVAMASYHGELYIEDQLSSIVNQTLLPLEIVIVDDASSDHTLMKIEQFKVSSPVPIVVIRAEVNQGSTASFAQAIAACQGAWIALADQDDVWLPTKLEKLHGCAEENSWDAIFSDAEFVDKNLQSLNSRLLVNSRLTRAMRADFLMGKGFPSLLRYNVVTGATMMFRSKWRPLILPIAPKWIHDYWIALLLACVGKVGLYEECLVLYRQHGKNQIGAKSHLTAEIGQAKSKANQQYLQESSLFKNLREKLQVSGHSSKAAVQELERKEEFLHRRYDLRQKPSNRLKYFVLNLCQRYYFRYGQGWRPLLKDLLIP